MINPNTGSMTTDRASVLRPEQTLPAAIDYFSKFRLQKNVALIVFLLLVNKLGIPGNLLCYAALFFMALKGPQGAIKALSISGLLIAASDFYVSRGAPVGPLKYLLLLVAGVVILRGSRNIIGQPFLVLLLIFGGVCAVMALYNGYFVQVSLLKTASFTFGAFCLLNAAQLRRNIAPEMLAWGFSLTIAIVLLSYAALAIGAGYGSYETIWGGKFSGYRGVFSHPQTLGVMASLLAVFLTSLLLFVTFPYRKLALYLLLGLLFLLYLSEARTGMLGYVLTVAITLSLIGMSRPSRGEKSLLARYRRQFIGVAFLGMIVLLVIEGFSGAVSERTTKFLAKGDQVESLSVSVLLKARQDQIDRSWDNFKQNPWAGINFGTDLDPNWQRKATLLSASTEKGFLPTALLEEVGIIGATLFALFIFSLFGFLLRGKRYLGLALFAGLLVVNLGEMMFFSFGGMAMLCWPLIAMSITVSNAQLQPLRQAPIAS